MDRRFVLSLALLALIGGSALAGSPAAPRTVRDFFLLLPDRYVHLERGQRKTILDSGNAVVDVKNGYLSFQDSAEDRTEVALFRRTDGGYVVGVVYNGPNPRTKRIEDEISELHLLRYEKGRWQDVTRALFPLAPNPRLVYTLPRHGTTIRVRDLKRGTEQQVVWNRTRFVLKR